MRRLYAFLTAVGVFAADRWTKWLVENHFGPWDTRTVIPGFFNLVRSENPGVAFGIFAENASSQRTFMLVALSIVAILILTTMLWKIDRQDSLTATGLSLIFGGAIGNVYDRIRSGAVTDFLDFYTGSHHWYTFNLADSAICIGAGLLILSMLLSSRKKELRV
ncbi:MAG TPA: signal peptidase II [Bryobacteraceae bacterium]|nr:signal peptidase II [Bryobacteraceae bacterium]